MSTNTTRSVPEGFKPHTESSTTILVPKGNTAFLNPVQQYNRDLSIAVIRAWNEMRKEEARAKYEAKSNKKGKKQPQPASATGTEADAAQPEAGPSKPFKARQITILEALSATGLRAIRYAKEIPDVRTVLANDISPSACEAMRMNVDYNDAGKAPDKPVTEEMSAEEKAQNGIEEDGNERSKRRPGCEGYVHVNENDACMLMYEHRNPAKRVDVVDLDPYGTAAPFIDAAVQAVVDGGLLAVTCTDLAVLAGSQYPEKCYSNYGGVSVNTSWSHEAALRLVLNSISTAAARYGRVITPLISFSIDFYVRLFIRVDSRPNEVKKLASQMGTVYSCHFCHSFYPQPFGRVVEKETNKGDTVTMYKTAPGPSINGSECPECSSTLHLGGPMWLAPIHNVPFVQRVLQSIEGQEKEYGTWPRIHGMLTLAANELESPFYTTSNKIFGTFHSSSAATTKVVSALLNGGYKVSRSHAAGGSIKTDAPPSFIYDIVREHIKTNPVRMDKVSEGSPTRKAIAKPMTHEIDFTPHPDVKHYEKADKVVYYQTNPQAHWGPAARAKNVRPPPQSKEKRKADAEASDAVGAEGETKKAKVEPAAPGGGEEDALNA